MDERAKQRDAQGAPVPAEPRGSQAAVVLHPEEIRAIRERLGLSQAKAGTLIGVSEVYDLYRSAKDLVESFPNAIRRYSE